LGLNISPEVDKYDLSSVSWGMCGAAPLSGESVEKLVKRLKLKDFRQGYGMTETSPLTHLAPPGDKNSQAIGTLLSNTEARVVDLEGKSVGFGSDNVGEILIRGPQVMKGYLNNPEATKITIDSEGWIHTGDLGYVDEKGYFYVVDRLKELIKVNGLQVAPAELEALLVNHPGIADAAVIGIPNEKSGEAPKAYVVRKSSHTSLTAKEIADYIAKQVAGHKHLRGGIEFVDSIPKSASGKILRRLLRDQVKSKL
jgi:acyl-CoA synthetase (AMP-forming)/AMP-acid ligase II